ncbi:hypothetical protein ADK57_09175 [Streptomyces sp. MMG1533]|uniref:hypothetical protein n=1 Tax=Streptomyces sp. MMG1533 TaxID=1415546 RepID=UPI0006AEE4FE|nr:hypothetical protein [Streptomyces sp. MMG1533]KOU73274.1 hypothetical protein ADK57_09175 [Streptomyces sp. MMG1533]
MTSGTACRTGRLPGRPGDVIVLLRGRGEEHRERTEVWLRAHEVRYEVLVPHDHHDRVVAL